MNNLNYLTISVISLFYTALTDAVSQESYPVPPKTKNSLFYFQRSLNRNTIVYEINTLYNGSIDDEKPVVVYWLRYEEGGMKKELSFIQQNVFGLQWKMIDKIKKTFVLYFNCYKKRELYLKKSGDNYKVFTKINSEFAELNRLFVKAGPDCRMVEYVDIYGINPENGNSVFERFIP